MQPGPLISPSGAFDAIIAIAVFIILWILTSFPLYLASKILVHERSQIVRALAGTFFSAATFLFFLFLFSFLFPPMGLIMGFVGILFVLMIVFQIGLTKAFVMAILTFIVYAVLLLLLAVVGIVLPFVHLI
jgi:hypothetical protein